MSEFEDKLNAILSSPEAMEQITAIANSLNQSGGEAAPGEPEQREDPGAPVVGRCRGNNLPIVRSGLAAGWL